MKNIASHIGVAFAVVTLLTIDVAAQKHRPAVSQAKITVDRYKGVVCGTVESLDQVKESSLSGANYEVTNINFSDGRRLKLIGLPPEITIEKGKMYSFTMSRNGTSRGEFSLFRTQAANICGYKVEKK